MDNDRIDSCIWAEIPHKSPVPDELKEKLGVRLENRCKSFEKNIIKIMQLTIR